MNERERLIERANCTIRPNDLYNARNRTASSQNASNPRTEVVLRRHVLALRANLRSHVFEESRLMPRSARSKMNNTKCNSGA